MPSKKNRESTATTTTSLQGHDALDAAQDLELLVAGMSEGGGVGAGDPRRSGTFGTV